ncbi:DoxX family protein, partial [Escherichia coli]|nr:DoxX family protein [Escherichia coli]
MSTPGAWRGTRVCITFKSHHLAKGLVMNSLRYF